MVYTVSLDNGFSGEHMGLVFAGGEARTAQEGGQPESQSNTPAPAEKE